MSTHETGTGTVPQTAEGVERLVALLEISRTLDTTGKLEGPMKLALTMAQKSIDGDAGSIMLVDLDGRLKIRSSTGIDPEIVAGINANGIGPDEESIAGHVFKHRKSLLLEGENGGELGNLMRGRGIVAALSVPIMEGARFLGVLNVNITSAEKTFDEDDLSMLESVAQELYSVIGRRRNLETLLEASMLLHGARSLEETHWAMERAKGLMGVNRIALFVVEVVEEELFLRGAFDAEKANFDSIRLPITAEVARKTPLVQAVVTQKTSCLELGDVGNVQFQFSADERDQYGLYQGFQTIPFAAIPMMVEGGGGKTESVTGVILIGAHPGASVSVEEITVMETFARIVAMVIEKADASDQLQVTLDQLRKHHAESVDALARALESKDPYTGGHSARVSEFAAVIGKEMGMSSEEIEILRRGGLVHDVGKLGVPQEILAKNGPLTPEEWMTVRKHPEKGEAIVSPSDIATEVAKFALTHHEREDGAGYPNGLTGSDLTTAQKIMIIADSFDAMTSKRPYREEHKKGIPVEVAVFELLRCAGTQFNVEVVKAFVAVLKTGIKVSENDREKTIQLGEPEKEAVRNSLRQKAERDADPRDRHKIDLGLATQFMPLFAAN